MANNNMYTVEDVKDFINQHLRFFRKITLLPILAIYLLMGVFQVGPDEEAVLLLFGRYEKTVGPGIHWYFVYSFSPGNS